MIYIPLSAVINFEQLGVSEVGVDTLHHDIENIYQTSAETASILTSCILGTLEMLNVGQSVKLSEEEGKITYKGRALCTLLPEPEVFGEYERMVADGYVYPGRAAYIQRFSERLGGT